MSCPIYGRETVEYVYTLVDADNAEVTSTLDWAIGDELVDTTDNSSERLDTLSGDVQDVIYESKGAKQIHCEIEFDSGWGDIYRHEANLEVTTIVYEEPVLAFDWTPLEPTVLEEVIFTQGHADSRLLDNSEVYGVISTSTMDYYNDGVDVTGLADTDEFAKTFSPKQDGIPLVMVSTYWDGWEDQTVTLTKSIDMTNIPPVSKHTREDAGQCIPAYIWTATSDDQDDVVEELTYEWWLYKKNDNGTPDDETDDTWEEIDSGVEITYTYPFQFEGDYKIVLRTTDDEGDWHDKIEEFPIVFDVCGTGDGGCSGTIILQPDRFQAVSIPVSGLTVNEYFIAKLEEVTGLPAIDSIEFVKAYPSNNISEKKYQAFVPGVTNPDSSYNFKLIENDGGTAEITPFFVKAKAFDGTIEIPWSTEDGI